MANRKFVAPTMNLALQKVKQELGKDAVILSHSTINGEVHLVASLQPETSLDILLAKGLKQSSAPILEMPMNESVLHESPSMTLQLQSEIAAIKRMISEFQMPNSHKAFTHAMQFFFDKKLQDIGFSSQLAEKILTDLPQDCSFEESIDLIAEQLLKNMPYRQGLPLAKYHGFIGPSGVGKTQSMIKIILHYLKNKSVKQFSCIFVNHHNLRVLEESKLCARIFNVPCYYVETQEDLAATLEKTADNDFVFIDFPAYDHILPENNYYIPFVEMYKKDFHNTMVYATSTKNFKQYSTLHENIIHELAITKLDENAQIGEFMQFSLKNQIPISFLSTGQNYAALENASPRYFENLLKQELCPTRERNVMDKVFAI